MKSLFVQDGTPGSFGDIQSDGPVSPDFMGLDQGVVLARARASYAPIAPIASGMPVSADAPSFTMTSSAGIISESSGGGFSSSMVSGVSVTTSTVIYAPLVITPVFGTSITSLNGNGPGGDTTTAAELEAAVNAAIGYYETNWTSSVPVGDVISGTTVNTVDVTLDFNYVSTNGGAASSSYGLTGLGSYSALLSATAGLLPNLPATDPTNGGQILETIAQADVLGISVAGTSAAGTVDINTVADGANLDYNLANQSIVGEIGAVGAIEHEIAENFGRTAILGDISNGGTPFYSILDLYRFKAAGTPALVAGTADYFSLNQGTTALGYFNDAPMFGGDAGDWASSGTHDVPADSYDAFITTGTAGTISSLDTMVLSSIGLRESVVTPTPRTLSWIGASGASFATAADWNDLTDSLNPAQSAPNATDTAQFLNGGGTITGAGTAAVLQFGGNASWDLASGASLSATTGVTVGQGGILLVNGGASISGLGASDSISGAAAQAVLVTVDGLGSTWKSAGELVIGNTSIGALTVSDGASATAAAVAAQPAVALGVSAGSGGSLLVTGAGSSATLTGQLNVGEAGSGTLTVANQGTLRTGNDAALDPSEGFDIAQLAGGSGAATVSGSKSLLANIGRFVIGDAGLGSLAITAGATVTTAPGNGSGTAGAIVANGTGASGSSVNVTGAGSDWQVGGLLDVGVAGSGALSLSGGATVTAGSLDAANGASAVAQISVSGAGSELLVTNAATVADDGTAVLSVLNGATVSAASLTIGSQTDSSGALVVSGSGSKLSISGQLNIGTALGTGDLTVGPGAVVDASVVNLQGGVVLEGGVLDPTVYIENGGSTTGGFGTIASDFILLEGTILSNGSKSGKQTEVVQGTLVGGGTATIQGSVSVNGPGILQIGTHDTIELTGAVLNAATTTFTDNLTPTGTYTVNNSVIDVVFQDTTGVLRLDDIAGFAGTVATWKAGDQFVVTGGTLSNLGVSNGDTLTFSDSGTGAGAGGIDSIIFGSGIAAGSFGIVNGNTVQAVACFAQGTRIGTAGGWVAVEDLRVGDTVIAADGAPGGSREAIVWIGQRTVRCAAHPVPEAVWPVRVRAGAFGENVPARDLYLSPDHAVFVNGVLVPVKLLIDGSGIVQVKRDRVRYFHVELPRHAIVLAEGLTVESYLDRGDRADFQDGDGAIRLFPAFGARLDTATAWETRGAAKLVLAGRQLDAARGVVARSAAVSPDRAAKSPTWARPSTR